MSQRTYTEPDCVQFVADMEAAGFDVEHYRGRNFWEGPAARAPSLGEPLATTSVVCQWDDMGLGYIVYPKTADEGVEVES